MYVSQHIKDAHYHCLQFLKVASHNPSISPHIRNLTFYCVSVSVVCSVPIYQPKLDQFHVMYVATMTSYYFN